MLVVLYRLPEKFAQPIFLSLISRVNRGATSLRWLDEKKSKGIKGGEG